jgi:hypothetical protein
LVDAAGSAITVFVDAETRLLAGTSGTVQSPVGEISVKTCFREHRRFDGVMRPTLYVLDTGFQQQRIALTELTLR